MRPSLRLTTKLLLLAVPLGLIAYDVIAVSLGGQPATISRTVYYWSLRYPLLVVGIPFYLGLLCGHLLIPQHPKPDELEPKSRA
jgi:hypothetical protein